MTEENQNPTDDLANDVLAGIVDDSAVDAAEKKQIRKPQGVEVFERTVMVKDKLEPMPEANQPKLTNGLKVNKAVVKAVATMLLLMLSGRAAAATGITKNFVVTAADQQTAEQVALQAEGFRKHLAEYWFGKPLPNWAKPCQVRVKVCGSNRGETKFQFVGGHVVNWRMCVCGTLEGILNSVIPHEVNHTLLASHFRRPLPRWYDEGAACCFEMPSEKRKLQGWLTEALGTGKWIPLSLKIGRNEYPETRWILGMYGESHAFAMHLLEEGPAKFLELGRVAASRGWAVAVQQVYGRSVEQIEQDVKLWIEHGFPRTGGRGGDVVSSGQTVAGAYKRYYFGAEWCEGCQDVKPFVEAAKLSEPAWNGQLAKTFGVKTLPTIIIAVDDVAIERFEGSVAVREYLTVRTAKKPQVDFPPGYQPPQFAESRQPSAPTLQTAEYDWKGVRIIAIASRDMPGALSYLKGPLDRLLTLATGGKVRLEIVGESDSPDRFSALQQATGISMDLSPLHLIVLIDRIAEPGFLKRQILKRIESTLEEKTSKLQFHVPIDAVFERIHRRHWQQILDSLQTMEAPVVIAATAPTGDDSEGEEPKDDGRPRTTVAFLIGLLGAMKSGRFGRYLWEYALEKMHSS